MLVFAAIDIGSNAIRLIIMNVFEDNGIATFKKSSLVRVPIRLGEDAFVKGRISKEKEEALFKAMWAFKQLMEIHNPRDYLACATSAMRNAENGAEIVKAIKDKVGIEINIIDGQREAEIVYSNHIAENMSSDVAYLYIEVGGGSTELTLFANKERIISRSFPVGTVRILHGLVEDDTWKEMKDWLKAEIRPFAPVVGIGSGGNINFLLKTLRKKDGASINLKRLRELRDYFGGYTLEQRIRELGLKPDRADVVMPAMDIFISTMKWARVDKIIVPKIGVADGIIHLLYERFRFQRILTLNDQGETVGEQVKV